MKIITIKNVFKTYPNGVGAIYDLNLDIEKGEFVFIIGGSGSGKSTLIKMLYREEKPTRGEIILGGVNVGKLKNAKVYKLRRKIGVVFQDYKLLPKLTVYENVAFALEVTGADTKDIRKRVIEVLEQVGLKHKAKSYPDKLSGGEQQRVAIARAIVNNPKILICDEPTGNLDSLNARELMEYLVKINEEKHTTIIMVTHDSFVASYSKKVYYMKDGHLDLSIDRLTKSQDDYYKDQSHLSFEERVKTNYDHPFAFDNDLLVEQLKQLKEGKSISKPTYDYTQHTRSDVVETITPRDVYILEGLFVLYDEKIRDLCDILVFVDTDADIRFIRRLKRDIEERGRSIDSVCNQYLETVRPMHEQFVEPSKKYAHIIIPEGGNNTVAIDLLITKISSVIDAKE